MISCLFKIFLWGNYPQLLADVVVAVAVCALIVALAVVVVVAVAVAACALIVADVEVSALFLITKSTPTILGVGLGGFGFAILLPLISFFEWFVYFLICCDSFFSLLLKSTSAENISILFHCTVCFCILWWTLLSAPSLARADLVWLKKRQSHIQAVLGNVGQNQ